MRSNNVRNKLLSMSYKITGATMIGIAIFYFIIKNGCTIYVDLTYNTMTTIGIVSAIIQIIAIPFFILSGITQWCLGVEMSRKKNKRTKNFNYIIDAK